MFAVQCHCLNDWTSPGGSGRTIKIKTRQVKMVLEHVSLLDVNFNPTVSTLTLSIKVTQE